MKKEITDSYENYTMTLGSSNRQKAYMAEITGPDGTYTFNRKFLEACEIGGNWVDYKLEEGKLYNWKERSEQHFGIVEDGKLYEINKYDATELVKTM